MAKDWLTGLFENKSFIDSTVATAIAAEDLVTYDTVTGQIFDDGTPITGIASMTFAQMEALTADQLLALAGLPVHISDVHNNSSGIGGSYVVRDSSPAGWAQVSGPFYYATFASAPNPATYAGWRIRVGDCGLGGADMIARGGYWRYPSGRQLVGAVTDLTFSSNKDTEQSAIKVTVPINNSKSLLQNGDSVWIEVHGSKSGTADRISRNIRIGTDASTVTNNTNFDPMATVTAANIGLDEHITFHRISATSIQRDSAQAWSSNSGMSTTARYSAVAVTSLDSALQYLDLTIYLTDGAADGIADTMSITSAKIFFDHGF